MNTHRTHLAHPSVARRRRPPARRLELFTTMPNARTATATDDFEQAEQLLADVLALVDRGLVTPRCNRGGQARYAITEESEPHDCIGRTTTRSEPTQ